MKKTVLFLLVAFSIANIAVYIKRNDFTYVKQSAYYELYPPYSEISLRSFEIQKDSLLQLNLNGPAKNREWLVKNDISGEEVTTRGEPPVIVLRPGVAEYSIQAKDTKDSLVIKVENITAETMRANGVAQGNRITVFESPLPATVPPSLTKWKQNRIPASPEELNRVKAILQDSMQVFSGDNSFTKAQKIASFLCRRIAPVNGIMSDSVKGLSACGQYDAALAFKSIDCGAYANIFSLFATEAGVTNRIIEMKHSYGTFDGNIHVFNEYYIEELKQWAAADIMLNNLSYTDASGKYLNAVDIKNRSQQDSLVTVLHASAKKDSLFNTTFARLSPQFFNYYSHDKDLYYYYTNDLSRLYSFKNKWKRYFFKDTWYELYSDVSIIDNKRFYIKQALLSCWLITLVLFIGLHLPARRKSKA